MLLAFCNCSGTQNCAYFRPLPKLCIPCPFHLTWSAIRCLLLTSVPRSRLDCHRNLGLWYFGFFFPCLSFKNRNGVAKFLCNTFMCPLRKSTWAETSFYFIFGKFIVQIFLCVEILWGFIVQRNFIAIFSVAEFQRGPVWKCLCHVLHQPGNHTHIRSVGYLLILPQLVDK